MKSEWLSGGHLVISKGQKRPLEKVVWTDRVEVAIINSRNTMVGGWGSRRIGLRGQLQTVGPEPLLPSEMHCPVVLNH